MIITLTLMMTQKKKELESSYDKQIGRVLHMQCNICMVFWGVFSLD